mmetsp:Transcript_66227/g.149516  ORF Transcript_66227/g.149516 Transcript_66227/m.149516 type:complete len:395 (-) Transcript_66227:75-1259(-)
MKSAARATEVDPRASMVTPVEVEELPVAGLRLWRRAIGLELQIELAERVEVWLAAGRRGDLPGKTYAPVPPNFAHAAQSREMLQFGAYTHSNRVEMGANVAPLPPLLARLVAQFLARGLLPRASPVGPAGPAAHPVPAREEAVPGAASTDRRARAQAGPEGCAKLGREEADASTSATIGIDDGGSLEGRPPAWAEAEANLWCCTVNCYEAGQWIPPHVDSPKFARPFATLSLVSEQAMEFAKCVEQEATNNKAKSDGEGGEAALSASREEAERAVSPEGAAAEGAAAEGVSQEPGAASPTVTVQLPVGSLLVLGGASADEWTHAVPPVTRRRLSLTFRRLRTEVAAEGAAEAAAKAAARQTKGEARRQAKLVIALWEPRALVPALSPTLATHFS